VPPRSIHDVLELQMPPSEWQLVAAVEDALGAVDSVHAFPDHMPTVPIRAIRGRAHVGWYRTLPDGSPLDILISRDGDDPGFTLLHELGHLLDHQGLGSTPGECASASDELDDWRAAVDASEAVHDLGEMNARSPILIPTSVGAVVALDPEDFEYLLRPEELFARSYSQWIASKGVSETLLQELEATRRMLYPEQWSEEDFTPIGESLERLLGRLR
jgi:hypothetical protein